MLKISNLQAKLIENDHQILTDVNLEVAPGELHLIMGPNGAGKSSLAKALMAHPSLEVSGDVEIDGQSRQGLETSEIAKAGLFLAHQAPVEIAGVKLVEFLRTAYNALQNEDEQLDPWAFVDIFEIYAQKLGLGDHFSSRYLNDGFSGGEKKKSEVLQMLVMHPKYAILDEIDSGLDLDSLKLVFNEITEFAKEQNTGVIIITHNPKILDYIKPNRVHLLKDGTIEKSGDSELAREIINSGYNLKSSD